MNVRCPFDCLYIVFVAVRNAGIDTISGVVEKLNSDLTSTIEAFKPINASCIQKLDSAISSCSSCVKSKCEARYGVYGRANLRPPNKS